MQGIHKSLVDSPQKGQWRGAVMFSLICAWTNDWANNRDGGDLRHNHAHYDVTIMSVLYNQYHSCWCSCIQQTKQQNPQNITGPWLALGCGLLANFLFPYFPYFSSMITEVTYWVLHIYLACVIVACRDTWQIWTWFTKSWIYLFKIKIFPNLEITEQRFSNPHPLTWALRCL